MKKILLLAAATVVSGPAMAQSQVELYGDIELGVFFNRSLSGGNDRGTEHRLDDTGSLIGVKGEEDLGGGLSAVWQIESDFSADGTDINGNGSLASSDTFLGLTGSWGTLRLGNLSSYLNGDMETMDSWVYTPAGVGGLGIMTRFDSVYGNSIRYDLPTLAGFDFTAMVSFDESDKDINNWSFGAGYRHNDFFAKLGAVIFQHQDGGNHTGSYLRLEGGMEGSLSIIGAVQYSRQYGDSATGGTNNIWGRDNGVLTLGADDKLQTLELAATVSYEMGAFVPRASIAWGNDAKVNGKKLDDSGYVQFVIGSDYNLSPRTQAYATLGYVKYDDKKYADGFNDNEMTVGVGLKHTF